MLFHLQRGPILQRQFAVAQKTARPGARKLTNSGSKDGRQKRCSSFASTSVAGAIKEEVKSMTSSSNNIFSRMTAWYSRKLDSHPLLTKSITGGIVAASGDIITQAGVYDSSEHVQEDGTPTSFWRDVYDPRRTFHFWILGSFFAAPTGHFWYNYLARHHAGQGFKSLTWRVFLDQYVYTPFWTVAWLAGLWTLEGTPPRDLSKRMVEHFPDVIVANWILWTPAQYLNFYAVPVKYQVLFTNVVELLWNAYLSFAAAGKGEAHHTTSSTKESKQDEVRPETSDKQTDKEMTL